MWLNKNKILEISKKKEIIFWGSGEWVEKTIKLLGKKPKYIIDINSNIQGSTQRGLKIISPDDINLKNYFVIVTTGSYDSVLKTLQKLNVKNFTLSPVLRNLHIRTKIMSIDKNILFSVPDIGGGVFIYNTLNKKLDKIFDGKSRAIAKSKNFIVVADEIKGLIVFDKKLNFIKEIELLPFSFCHGVAISEQLNQIYVANSGRDSVSIYELTTFKHIQEIKISDKFDLTNEEQHHINDLYIDEKTNKLLISMFSFSGRWRENIYDGGVLEYDLNKNILSPYPLIGDLWMPHSITIIENNMFIIDSMRGDLYKTSNKIIGKFAGFIRGLDYDGEYFYIAQSTTRYFDRLENISLNIPLNCGIYVFDEKTKASYLHNFDFENIHSLIII